MSIHRGKLHLCHAVVGTNVIYLVITVINASHKTTWCTASLKTTICNHTDVKTTNPTTRINAIMKLHTDAYSMENKYDV
jgi:hypothetical protein